MHNNTENKKKAILLNLKCACTYFNSVQYIERGEQQRRF